MGGRDQIEARKTYEHAYGRTHVQCTDTDTDTDRHRHPTQTQTQTHTDKTELTHTHLSMRDHFPRLADVIDLRKPHDDHVNTRG